jgi:hypothetical protein
MNASANTSSGIAFKSSLNSWKWSEHSSSVNDFLNSYFNVSSFFNTSNFML